MLFDHEGRPKNAQIGELFDALCGLPGQDVPLDLIIVSRERWVPRRFRRAQDKADDQPGLQEPLIELRRRSLRPAQSNELDLRAKIFCIDNAAPNGIPQRTTSRSIAYIHFLYATRGVLMALSYFPSVALVIGLDELRQARARTEPLTPPVRLGIGVTPGVFGPIEAEHARFEIKNLLGVRDDRLFAERAQFAKECFPKLIALAAARAEQGGKWSEFFPAGPCNRAEALDAEAVRKLYETIENGAIGAIAQKAVDGDTNKMKDLINEVAESIDDRMRQLFQAVAERRFVLTVLFATAYQFLLPVAERGDADAVQQCVDECANFLTNTRLKLEGLPSSRRADVVIDTAMRTLRELDTRARAPLPGGGNIELGDREIEVSAGLAMYRLQRTLLWHLAVIGQPVVARVLAHAPVVMDATMAVLKEVSKDIVANLDEDIILAVVRKGLRVLELRCLAIAVAVRGSTAEEPLAERRYTVHPLIQRSVFRRLHAPFGEYAEADEFSITLYLSQPHDVPRLTGSAHAQVKRSIEAMIGFPEADPISIPYAPWTPLPRRRSEALAAPMPDGDQRLRDLNHRAQMLRAALGMVRSVYSLGTVVRLAPTRSEITQRDSGPERHRGVLEEQRLLLRWMLRQAVSLDGLFRELPASTAEKQLRPFYAEEVVWLYNECAVLSLAQGRLSQSLALFDRADTAASALLEPHVDGPLRRHIQLNSALVDIERGRLSIAESALARICDIKNHVGMGQMADGMLGLVAHIRGQHAAAIKHYDSALQDGRGPNGKAEWAGLLTLGRSRAASIVSRHYGNLWRSVGEFRKADEMMRQAITLAIEGGHEDVHLEARLSSVQLIIARGSFEDGQLRPLDGPGLHMELDVVEDYARVMGMPRLQCDVDLVRTTLHRLGGDLKAAANIASRGLTVAAANDLRLRKTRFLLQLATIYERRGQVKECTPLLEEAFDLARETEYHTARAEGQALFARIAARGP